MAAPLRSIDELLPDLRMTVGPHLTHAASPTVPRATLLVASSPGDLLAIAREPRLCGALLGRIDDTRALVDPDRVLALEVALRAAGFAVRFTHPSEAVVAPGTAGAP